MSEKLHLNDVNMFTREYYQATQYENGDHAKTLREAFFARIEADREAVRLEAIESVMHDKIAYDIEKIREETRAEVLSSENVMSITEIENAIYGPAIATGVDQFAAPGSQDFGFWVKTKLYPAIQKLTVQRPLRKRALNREEKVARLLARFSAENVIHGVATDDGIDAYCQLAGIPVEVEE